MGAFTKSTLGCDSFSTLARLSQRAPSMNRPWAYTPSLGWFEYSVRGIISKPKATWSMGTVYLRAKFCDAPVRKACVKKKPEIQNTLGGTSCSQLLKNSSRVYRSVQ